jgi:hypothetical protein
MPRRGESPLATGEVESNEIIEQVSVPVTLAAGHQLRGQRCVVCATLIGGQLARIVTVIDTRPHACSCGAVNTITMMMCDAHGDGAGIDLFGLLSARWALHHLPGVS